MKWVLRVALVIVLACAYAGWPDRLYVIDREGRVAYKSGPGPFGFKPAAVETTLVALLGTETN